MGAMSNRSTASRLTRLLRSEQSRRKSRLQGSRRVQRSAPGWATIWVILLEEPSKVRFARRRTNWADNWLVACWARYWVVSGERCWKKSTLRRCQVASEDLRLELALGALLGLLLFDLLQLLLKSLIENAGFLAPRLAFRVGLRGIGGDLAPIYSRETISLTFQFGA